MTQIQYRNRSISQLVQQLNILGQTDVSIVSTHLLAIHSDDYPNIRRFKSKSSPEKQFFQCQKNQKKYNYQQIAQSIENSTLLQQTGPLHQYLDNGYNVTIILENQKNFVKKLLTSIDNSKYLQNWNCFCAIVQNNSEILDLFGDCRISFRDLQNNNTYYQSGFNRKCWQNNEKKLQQKLVSLSFTKTSSLIAISSVLTIILLPPAIFQPSPISPWSIVKSQLYQVLNYIRTNPQKRYQNISKLITKRHPFTSYFAKIFMQDSINIVINQINQKNIIGKMDFYDKLGVVSNLIKKSQKKTQTKILSKPVIQRQQNQINKKSNKEKNTLEASKPKNISISPIKHHQKLGSNSVQNFAQTQKSTLRNKTHSNIVQSKLTNCIKNQLSPIYAIKNRDFQDIDRQNQFLQHQLSAKELNYCRSLQRKTHKFSISPALNTQQSQLQGLYSPKDKTKSKNQFSNVIERQNNSEQNSNINFFKETKFKSQTQNTKIQQENNPKQAISILKAQHACQVSQYHQTIQNLNKKILILTNEKGLEQLYAIHERQIMLLQLKIQQLRGDIKQLTKDQLNDKSMKFMVRKLNQQIQRLQQNNTKKKITQSKMVMLQKELKDFKLKYQLSQKARKNLSCQVDALTKRLKIRDAEVRQIHQHQLERYNSEDLSLTEDEVLSDVKKLILGIQKGERNCSQFLVRKITNILGDLSKTRDIILQCNDFLVQLQQLLENQLSTKQPQIVLDCNKFIRQFLINNLAIF